MARNSPEFCKSAEDDIRSLCTTSQVASLLGVSPDVVLWVLDNKDIEPSAMMFGYRFYDRHAQERIGDCVREHQNDIEFFKRQLNAFEDAIVVNDTDEA